MCSWVHGVEAYWFVISHGLHQVSASTGAQAQSDAPGPEKQHGAHLSQGEGQKMTLVHMNRSSN